MNDSMRALVVDDESAIRRLTVRALQNYSFACDEATDGGQALEMSRQRKYEVVVTDLRMPKQNGHSLAVELAGRGIDRPLVVVLTGVLEPRLAADLIARGVDDIVFKPVDFNLFGAKVRALCDRRRRQQAGGLRNVAAESDPCGIGLVPLTMDQIEQCLNAMAGALPVSQAAIDVVNLIEKGTPSVEDVARSIARDPSLTIEVLRLANSVYYNTSGRRIDDLQQAVVRVGHRQISHLALAATTLRALTKTALPWIDADLVWQRSVAAGLAIEHLYPSAELGADDEGLFLSSLLLPMSRVLLGLAFPDFYQRMVANCNETGCSLASLERRLVPIPPVHAMASILIHWNLSPRLFKPLQQSGLPYSELSALTEPLRRKAERLRIAELVGQLAVGRFDSWDEIDFPPPETMRRLPMQDLGPTIEQVRSDMAQILGSVRDTETVHVGAENHRLGKNTEIRYFKLTVEPYDLLTPLVEGMNLNVVRIPREAACQAQPALVNCLDVSPERLEWFLNDAIPDISRSLVCSSSPPPHSEALGPVVQLPCSFAAFAKAISVATLPGRVALPTASK